MFATLKQIKDKFNLKFDDEGKLRESLIIQIYNNNFEKHYEYDTFVLTQIGNYYRLVEKNYDEMKKYYLTAIEKENTSSMHNLAKYYYDIEKGHSDAMNNLGLYYENIKKNYDEMKKYYLMAIEKGNSNAMNNLAIYYKDVEINYELMKKYYLMAIKKNNYIAMHNLGLYYQEIKKYKLMKKYYEMAIEKGYSGAMYNLAIYYHKIKKYTEMKKYYEMAIEKGNQNKLNNDNLKKMYSIINQLFPVDKTEECNICYEEKEMYYASCYNHTMCLNCSIRLFKKSCPYCRQMLK